MLTTIIAPEDLKGLKLPENIQFSQGVVIEGKDRFGCMATWYMSVILLPGWDATTLRLERW